MHPENLKDIGVLLLGGMFFYCGYQTTAHPDHIKDTFPNQYGGAPRIVIRGIGMTLLLFGALLVYIFVKSFIA